MPLVLLIDGHSLAYRAYHALPSTLQTSQGEPTNAVYGFAVMLFDVLKQEKPDYVMVAFDKGPSFRVKQYTAYKANRAQMPEVLRQQMARIHELVELLHIPYVEVDGFEGDDVLGTLAAQATAQGMEVLIVTGDRDALQLVDEHTHVLTSGRRFGDTIRYTPELVREKYGGLEPAQLVDLKGLVGDTSDNIPGVSGIGEKGAIELLRTYGTLEELYAHLDEVKPRYRQALEEQRERAFLSRELGRIRRDAPVVFEAQRARWSGYDREALVRWLRTLEFSSLLGRLPALAEPASSPKQAAQLPLFAVLDETPAAAPDDKPTLGRYHRVTDEVSLRALVERLWDCEVLALDTETTGMDALQAELVGVALTDRAGTAWYVPVRAPDGAVLPLAALRVHLGPLLARETSLKVGHNLKYDVHVLNRAGLPLGGRWFDTMVAEWVLNPATPNLGLKALAWTRLGMEMTPIEELIGRGKEQLRMDQVPLAQVTAYAGADVDATFRLAQVQSAALRERGLEELFYGLEMPLLPVLVEMEATGVLLDVAWLQQLSAELEARLRELVLSIHTMAGRPFNINSTQQLSEVLFEVLKLPTRGLPKTKTGHYSTNAEVLEKLRHAHPVVELILQHRELAKLKSTYVDALPQLVNPQTGRVHTSYNQTGTVTGRLSSSNPNLQNIPIRTEEGRRVRRAFVARPGWKLIGADYSQIELRVMAHVSGDAGLIEAFRRGEDIHTSTAAAIFEVAPEAVTPEMRRQAKAVNFGLIYGQGVYGLATQLGISNTAAEAFIARYFQRFPKVRETMERLEREAVEQGYVTTLLGRRRYFPELQPGAQTPPQQRQAALRMAINTPIQGTAADIIKLAMIRLHRYLHAAGLEARMILQVHDELVLEAPEREVARCVELMRDAMEHAYELAVPLVVDVQVGEHWEEMKG